MCFLWCHSTEHSSKWWLHQGLVCHEDIPHSQRPHHHDLVLEENHPDDQATCSAGKVRFLCFCNFYKLVTRSRPQSHNSRICLSFTVFVSLIRLCSDCLVTYGIDNLFYNRWTFRTRICVLSKALLCEWNHTGQLLVISCMGFYFWFMVSVT